MRLQNTQKIISILQLFFSLGFWVFILISVGVHMRKKCALKNQLVFSNVSVKNVTFNNKLQKNDTVTTLNTQKKREEKEKKRLVS